MVPGVRGLTPGFMPSSAPADSGVPNDKLLVSGINPYRFRGRTCPYDIRKPYMVSVIPNMGLEQREMGLEQREMALEQRKMALEQPEMALEQWEMALEQQEMALE